MPEQKPSKAARELAAKIAFIAYGPYIATLSEEEGERCIAPYAEQIQSALTNLLEKAQAVTETYPRDYQSVGDLAEAIEPWTEK